MRDRGEYFCRAQNSEGFGLDSRTFHVEIKGKIQVMLDLLNNELEYIFHR
jgi:hypothetical protein